MHILLQTTQPVPSQWAVNLTTILAGLGGFLVVAVPLLLKLWGMARDAKTQATAAQTQADANVARLDEHAQTIGRQDTKINEVALATTPAGTPPKDPPPRIQT